MRTKILAIMVFGLALAITGPVRADEKAEAKAIVDKAIEAHGGEAELKKLENVMQKLKGTIHVMGMEIPFTGDIIVASESRIGADIEIDVNNMKIQVINIVNKDKGWAKVGPTVTDMTKDQIAEAREQSNVGAISNLAPLKDKAYTISLVGEDKVGTTPVQVVRISRKDFRDVNLFFDKKTHLLVKTEARAKDEAGQEVNEERFFSDYNDKGLKQAKKLTVKRDGKTFMDAEILESKVDEKFNDGTFDKP